MYRVKVSTVHPDCKGCILGAGEGTEAEKIFADRRRDAARPQLSRAQHFDFRWTPNFQSQIGSLCVSAHGAHTGMAPEGTGDSVNDLPRTPLRIFSKDCNNISRLLATEKLLLLKIF